MLSNKINEPNTTTMFESVIATGNAVLLADDAEKTKVLEVIVQRLAPTNVQGGMAAIQRLLPAVAIIRIDVEQLTGKANR